MSCNIGFPGIGFMGQLACLANYYPVSEYGRFSSRNQKSSRNAPRITGIRCFPIYFLFCRISVDYACSMLPL